MALIKEKKLYNPWVLQIFLYIINMKCKETCQ